MVSGQPQGQRRRRHRRGRGRQVHWRARVSTSAPVSSIGRRRSLRRCESAQPQRRRRRNRDGSGAERLLPRQTDSVEAVALWAAAPRHSKCPRTKVDVAPAGPSVQLRLLRVTSPSKPRHQFRSPVSCSPNPLPGQLAIPGPSGHLRHLKDQASCTQCRLHTAAPQRLQHFDGCLWLPTSNEFVRFTST